MHPLSFVYHFYIVNAQKSPPTVLFGYSSPNLLQTNPQPAKRHRAYSHSALTDAYLAVKDGKLAVTRASRQYGIPEQTLWDRVLGEVDIDCVTMGTAPNFLWMKRPRLFII